MMTIIVHEILYFERPTSITTYSDIPNESPDISRLLNGQKPFPSSDTVLQKVPKKIIVNLNFYIRLTKINKRRLNLNIQRLQDDGLLVYYYHKNQLHIYEPERINGLKAPSPFPSIEYLSQMLSIPTDELAVINEWVTDFKGCDARNTVELSNFTSLRSKERIQSIYIQSDQSHLELDALLSEFPNINHLFLKTPNYEQLLNFKQYYHLSKLERIDLDLSNSSITNDQLAEILAGLKIEVLNLNVCQNLTEALPLEGNSLDLKVLDLSISPITGSALLSILKAATKLQVLILHDCSNLSDGFSEELHLPELQELDLSNSSIPGIALAKVLETTPKLKMLNLSRYSNIQEVPSLKHMQLPELEEIYFCEPNLSEQFITNEVLINFLSIAPNIKRLQLELCTQIWSASLDGLSFSKLEQLGIRYSYPSSQSLFTILDQAKGLKQLSLSQCDFSVNLPALYLPELESLDLSYSTISTEALNGLLHHGSHIKYLDLGACPNINESVADDSVFPNLETLIIESSPITSDTLYKILRTAQQLKILTVRFCDKVNYEFPDDINLPELIELNLNLSTITYGSLLKLISKSPHLKKLNLLGWPNLDENLISQLQRPGLEIIYSNGSENKEFKKLRHELSDYEDEMRIVAPKHPPVYNAHSQKYTIDADTRAQEQVFQVERIFMGKPSSPDPRELRYEIFDGFLLNATGGIKEPFILQNTNSDYRLSDDFSKYYRSFEPLFDTYSKSNAGHYFCRTRLLLTTSFQALPSAFADEVLQQFYINSSVDIELVKSHYTDLHYIRLKNEGQESLEVTFEMLLTHQKPHALFSDLPQGVRDLVKFCRGFREESLKTISPFATSQEFLEALIKERAGACRHRSIVFMYLLRSSYPQIPVRLVRNTVHMFVEVNFYGQWIACDLGGYPANVKVNEQGLPEYEPGELKAPGPEEIYALTMSDTGTPLAPGFFEQARNLTNLTLDRCAQLPLQYDLSMLDTLNITNSTLTADTLLKLLTLTPNLKTLILKNCSMTSEDFNRLDFSHFKNLEHINLIGSFIPNTESALRLMQTAPKARWIIESAHFFLEEETKKALQFDLEIRKKSRPLPSRYFAERSRNLEEKKEAFDILTPSKPSISVRKTLVDTSDAERSRLLLQKTATSLGQLHYYIDSPDALRCAGPYIRREGERGYIEHKAGGPLYDFLNSNPGIPKKLIINYDTFRMSDFASLNSILDDPSELDGIELPSDVHIIGLLNQKNPDVYQGADFYSRFDEFQSIAQVNDKLSLKSIPLEANRASTTEILELCGGEQWESRLIGHWLLQESRLIFKDGLLLEALKAGKSSFSFNNAPLHDPKFVSFFHDLTSHSSLVHQGHDYGPLPKEFHVVLTQGVHLPEKDTLFMVSSEEQLTTYHVLLNQANLSDFLGGYLLDEKQHQLIFQEGLIASHGKQVLPVYLAGSLSLNTWLKLLEACRYHKTRLQITLAPDVHFPEELAMDTAHLIQRPVLIPTASTAFNPQEFPKNPDLIIETGELNPDELLATFKCDGFNARSKQFEFTPIHIYPWEALQEGKTVVFKGEWTQELADAMQTIIFLRLQQDYPPGRLICYSKHPKLFHALPETPFNEALKIPPQTLDKSVDYDERLQMVEAALKEHPFVLITGATGVGKTHFVSRTWKEAYPACYYGEQQILDFLISDASEGYITLYLNEANLANKQWAMFEGLFNNPPAIFYKNHYYPLTARHKIIFDGNPIEYGGERHTPRLFQNHPYQLHFQPLPREVLSQMIALPPPLDAPVLDVVIYMAGLNPDDTLLTPREIKMMGALVKASMIKYPHIQPEHMARYFAYTLSKNHVPRSFQNEFETRFKVESPFNIADVASYNASAHYLLNSSNLPAAVALQSHLLVREHRRQNKERLSLETGLGGLVIEGESGEGKSQLILTQLAAHGYKKDKDFIHISAKSKPNEIKEKLLKGFHEGLIVIIDEMNSLAPPEQLLNALLEGHDLQDQLPENPGFLLLGTQNPITYRGRLKTTSPLEHRLQKVVLPTSTLTEKKHILQQLGLPARIAQDMIGEYAQRSDLTFREVIKSAKLWVEHHQKEPPLQLDITPVKQVGSVCKIVAIANVENYYAKKLGYERIPLKSEHQKLISIRKLAKTHASSQGEILEFESWRQTLNDLGFTSEVVDFHQNMNHFVASITEHLKQGNLPLIAFPVDKDSGLPNPETKEPEEVEHAAVISGYNWQTDEFTLVHWETCYVVDAVTLFNATHKLPQTRHQEFYTKNPAYNEESKKWDVHKYLPTSNPSHPKIEKESIIPQKGTGFKAKLLIVHAPDKELLLQKREALAHHPKEKKLSFFKQVSQNASEKTPDFPPSPLKK